VSGIADIPGFHLESTPEAIPMKDPITQEPLTILSDGTDHPYVNVNEVQIDEICRFLDRHNIPYVVEDILISINGGPEGTEINFRRG